MVMCCSWLYGLGIESGVLASALALTAESMPFVSVAWTRFGGSEVGVLEPLESFSALFPCQIPDLDPTIIGPTIIAQGCNYFTDADKERALAGNKLFRNSAFEQLTATYGEIKDTRES